MFESNNGLDIVDKRLQIYSNHRYTVTMSDSLQLYLSHNILKVNNADNMCDFYVNKWGMKQLYTYTDKVGDTHRIFGFVETEGASKGQGT